MNNWHMIKIEHHAVLNAITRSIILCDSNVEEAKEGLYVLGDYLKHYFAATTRQETPASAQDLERLRDSVAALHRYLQNPAA